MTDHEKLSEDSGGSFTHTVVDDGEAHLSHDAEQDIIALARNMTQASRTAGDGEIVDNPFEGSTDPQLDPSSGKFNMEMWLKQVRTTPPMISFSRRAVRSSKPVSRLCVGSAHCFAQP